MDPLKRFIKSRPLRYGIYLHLGAMTVAALRFRAAGGIMTKEAWQALFFEPIHVWKVAIQGPGPEDLDQTDQTVVGG